MEVTADKLEEWGMLEDPFWEGPEEKENQSEEDDLSSILNDLEISAGRLLPIPEDLDESEMEMEEATFPQMDLKLVTSLGVPPDPKAVQEEKRMLDQALKEVLAKSPAEFVEWLVREGLLRSKIWCEFHQQWINRVVIDTESEDRSYIFSGGYAWHMTCCLKDQKEDDTHIPVIDDSIFHESRWPPATLLKLIYHWAFQTPSAKVREWTKVSNVYLKDFYVLIGAIITCWLHQYCPLLGGKGNPVEVGFITLPKGDEIVAILGAYDPTTKMIRMKVINAMPPGLFEKNDVPKNVDVLKGAVNFQILWALSHWVDPDSILVHNEIISESLLREIGFKNIVECQDNRKEGVTNENVLKYLRESLPKLFKHNLRYLKKPMVQSILDELSWREIFAPSGPAAFKNLLAHLGTVTEWLFGDQRMIDRLLQIADLSLLDWSYSKQAKRSPITVFRSRALREMPGFRECVEYIRMKECKQPPPPVMPENVGTFQNAKEVLAKMSYYGKYMEEASKIHSVQIYYYGTWKGDEDYLPRTKFLADLRCPICLRVFLSSKEVVRHLYLHVTSVGPVTKKKVSSICSTCLEEIPRSCYVGQHVDEAHKMIGCASPCRICEVEFQSDVTLTTHMWDLHGRREAPYRCSLCDFASSFHHSTLEHFKEKHGREAYVMCPCCLKVLECGTEADLQHIFCHLKNHFDKIQSKNNIKCSRCVLSFTSKLQFEKHLRDHISRERTDEWNPHRLSSSEVKVWMAEPPKSKTPLDFNLLVLAEDDELD